MYLLQNRFIQCVTVTHLNSMSIINRHTISCYLAKYLKLYISNTVVNPKYYEFQLKRFNYVGAKKIGCTSTVHITISEVKKLT